MLGKDTDHTYDLVYSSNEKHNVKKGNKIIKIQGSSDALHIHEIRHVALALGSSKGLVFSDDNLLRPAINESGLNDEIEGYRAQYSFDPNSLPEYDGNYNGINSEYIGNITDSNGNLVYPAINEAVKASKRQSSKKK